MLAAQVILGAGLVWMAVNGWPGIGKRVEQGRGTAGATPQARPGGVPAARLNRFFAGRAFAEARFQVSLGPRPARTAPSRRLAEHLRTLLPRGRFEAVPGGLRNVVGTVPGRRPAVVIAAHYDTKDLPGFVGANDGAAGAASVVELARRFAILPRRPKAPELRFVLFDGEESPRGTPDTAQAFLRAGLRGSKAYVRAHRREVGRMILLDFVGDRRLSLPRESGSDPVLWARLRVAAARVGVAGAFPPRTTGTIFDDHTPFARAGVPSIDLIDFEYPFFHTAQDTLDKISPASLDIAGEAVAELVLSL